MFNNGVRGASQMPTIVKNIIIINVLMFLLQNVWGENANDFLALHYWQSPYFKWWQVFTHMFMHGSIGHLFFNMFALWMFGSILENVFGEKRFLMFYLICGLGAAMCHLSVLAIQFHNYQSAFLYYQEHQTLAEYVNFLKAGNITGPVFGRILSVWSETPNCSDCAEVSISNIQLHYNALISIPTVGASGAVFGLLFAFGYLFPNTELMLLFPPIPIKAKWFVTGYAAIELFMGLNNSASDNIAHFAHLGGMLFAFILLWAWGKRKPGF